MSGLARAGIVAVCVGVLALSSCALVRDAPVPEPRDLACKWTSLTDEGAITPFVGGEVNYENLSLAVIEHPQGTDQTLVSGFGNWGYGSSFRDREGRVRVEFAVEGSTWEFFVEGSGENMRLVSIFGDEWSDDGYVFVKANCPGDEDWEIPAREGTAP